MDAMDAAGEVLVAGALGDALGARYEGFPWRWPIAAVHPGRSIQLWRSAMYWTDDTEMSLAVLLAAQRTVASGTLHGPLRCDDAFETAVLEQFLAWRRTGIRADMGLSTLRALGAVQEATPAAARASARNVGSAGNGAMMRAPACALLFRDTPEAAYGAALAIAELTHGTVDACQAAGVIAALCQNALRTGKLDRQVLGRFELGDEIRRALDSPAPPRLGRAKGWAPATLSGVLWCVEEIRRRWPPQQWLDRGLRFAVSRGGDTDTVGSLVGALLAALGAGETSRPQWAARAHGGAWTGTRWTIADLDALWHDLQTVSPR